MRDPHRVNEFCPIAGWIAAVAYGLTRDSLPFLDGQSIGKKAMGLRAVTEDGQPLTNNWGPGIIRNIVLWIPLFPLIELIVLLTNDKGLRLGDQWAKTKVISSKIIESQTFQHVFQTAAAGADSTCRRLVLNRKTAKF
jgi:uncharacterized RDD family membrane protein YckC